MSIEPGDLFIKGDGTMWIIVSLRGNGSWDIYCPSTNRMTWEWDGMLRAGTPVKYWRKLA